ncbi:MAG: tetratricopeptide repeat protein [Bdellovibrionales bacterium]|nr:tetratricopeptide repeat protein [Bdellovibrionales bacterium]
MKVAAAKEALKEGRAAQLDERYSTALEAYNRAIQNDPELVSAYLGRGLVKEKLNLLDEAIQDYDRALALAPEDESAYLSRGRAYLLQVQSEKALADFERSLSIEPENSAALFHRGLVALRNGDLASAMTDFERSAEIEPQSADAAYGRCLVLLERNLLEDALFACTLSLRLGYSSREQRVRARRTLVVLHHSLSSPEQAQAALQSALADSPDDPELLALIDASNEGEQVE